MALSHVQRFTAVNHHLHSLNALLASFLREAFRLGVRGVVYRGKPHTGQAVGDERFPSVHFSFPFRDLPRPASCAHFVYRAKPQVSSIQGMELTAAQPGPRPTKGGEKGHTEALRECVCLPR